MTHQCQHGHLARVCELCEKDAEIARLTNLLEHRAELQSAGTHPAPCARHCEAVAFEIEIRGLKRQRDALLSAARKAHDMIRIERQFFGDCNVGHDGTFEPGAREQIDEYDAVLGELAGAIASVEGGAA